MGTSIIPAVVAARFGPVVGLAADEDQAVDVQQV